MQSEACPVKEKTGFIDSFGRILAEDVVSDTDMPPFDKTAVDGFACRMADIRNELEIIETIPAGKSPEKKISWNQCSKIMTGAMIPEGADCILMVEYTEQTASGKIKFHKDHSAPNICFKGEDVKKGDAVLKKGTLIGPEHIAVLASVGSVEPFVFVRPRVGIISTGNELVEPEKKPQGSQIRNSNAYQLIAQIKKIGCIPNYIGIAEDTEDATYKIISRAMTENDVIILTGGVSMGDFDYVPQILSKLGFETLFESIAVQPGRPTVFAKHNRVYCFGLPGNPVSSFIQFEMLVKPLLYKLMGFEFRHINLKLPLSINYTRKRSDRLSLIPVKIEEDSSVTPIIYHGSAHIHAMTGADGVMFVPIGVTQINEGDSVDVRQI